MGFRAEVRLDDDGGSEIRLIRRDNWGTRSPEQDTRAGLAALREMVAQAYRQAGIEPAAGPSQAPADAEEFARLTWEGLQYARRETFGGGPTGMTWQTLGNGDRDVWTLGARYALERLPDRVASDATPDVLHRIDARLNDFHRSLGRPLRDPAAVPLTDEGLLSSLDSALAYTGGQRRTDTARAEALASIAAMLDDFERDTGAAKFRRGHPGSPAVVVERVRDGLSHARESAQRWLAGHRAERGEHDGAAEVPVVALPTAPTVDRELAAAILWEVVNRPSGDPGAVKPWSEISQETRDRWGEATGEFLDRVRTEADAGWDARGALLMTPEELAPLLWESYRVASESHRDLRHNTPAWSEISDNERMRAVVVEQAAEVLRVLRERAEPGVAERRALDYVRAAGATESERWRDIADQLDEAAHNPELTKLDPGTLRFAATRIRAGFNAGRTASLDEIAGRMAEHVRGGDAQAPSDAEVRRLMDALTRRDMTVITREALDGLERDARWAEETRRTIGDATTGAVRVSPVPTKVRLHVTEGEPAPPREPAPDPEELVRQYAEALADRLREQGIDVVLPPQWRPDPTAGLIRVVPHPVEGGTGGVWLIQPTGDEPFSSFGLNIPPSPMSGIERGGPLDMPGTPVAELESALRELDGLTEVGSSGHDRLWSLADRVRNLVRRLRLAGERVENRRHGLLKALEPTDAEWERFGEAAGPEDEDRWAEALKLTNRSRVVLLRAAEAVRPLAGDGVDATDPVAIVEAALPVLAALPAGAAEELGDPAATVLAGWIDTALRAEKPDSWWIDGDRPEVYREMCEGMATRVLESATAARPPVTPAGSGSAVLLARLLGEALKSAADADDAKVRVVRSGGLTPGVGFGPEFEELNPTFLEAVASRLLDRMATEWEKVREAIALAEQAGIITVAEVAAEHEEQAGLRETYAAVLESLPGERRLFRAGSPEPGGEVRAVRQLPDLDPDDGGAVQDVLYVRTDDGYWKAWREGQEQMTWKWSVVNTFPVVDCTPELAHKVAMRGDGRWSVARTSDGALIGVSYSLKDEAQAEADRLNARPTSLGV